jgi:putative transposase
MKEYQSLSHTRWDWKYHIVLIPKELASHQESRVVEGHLLPDHVHMCLSIPPDYAVAHVLGYMKGKSAINIARQFEGRKRNFAGEVFWACGTFASTVGLDEDMVGAYIRDQEKEDERYDQMKLSI